MTEQHSQAWEEEDWGICSRLKDACRVYGFPCSDMAAWCIQHGENPEHQLILDGTLLATHNHREIHQMVVDWVRRVHAYEQGARY